MSKWFRFYDCALDDPKVQKLAPELFKAWVNLLCLASRNEGVLPSVEDIAFALRVDEKRAGEWIASLTKSGLLDADGESLSPHNWHERQFRSDVSSERVKRFRNGKRNVSETADETPPEQSKSEQISLRDAAPKETPLSILTECLPEQTARDLIEHRKAKKSPMTPRAAKELAKEFAKYGDPELAVETMLKRGWTGFDPSWQGVPPPRNKPPPVTANGAFYAKAGSLQRDAWSDYSRQETGKSLPSDQHGGWWVQTEWPPGHEQRGAA